MVPICIKSLTFSFAKLFAHLIGSVVHGCILLKSHSLLMYYYNYMFVPGQRHGQKEQHIIYIAYIKYFKPVFQLGG